MRFLFLILFFFGWICTLPIAAQENSKPRVLILTTGGTIASRTDAPMAEGHQLVQAVPELLEYATIEVEEILRVGSSRITPEHWLRLTKRINALFQQDAKLAGIVVTHGTDSMEETAFFLHLTVKDTRPVVLVGSMRSSDEISADGPANLLNAVRIAVSDQAIGKGVLVALNEDIASARDVWKTDNRRVNTFRSPELGFLGFADPDTITFYRQPLKPHTQDSEFDISRIDSLPQVDIAVDYTGFDGMTIDFLAGRKPGGMVVATFAGGRMSAGATRGVRDAAQNGLPVVLASKVPGGRIAGNPQGEMPVVLARDLPAHKARILLILGLTQTKDVAALQELFDRY